MRARVRGYAMPYSEKTSKFRQILPPPLREPIRLHHSFHHHHHHHHHHKQTDYGCVQSKDCKDTAQKYEKDASHLSAFV